MGPVSCLISLGRTKFLINESCTSRLLLDSSASQMTHSAEADVTVDHTQFKVNLAYSLNPAAAV